MNNQKKNSINVTGSTRVCWPQYGKEEDLDMTDIGSKFNGHYATNNSTICYVVDHEVFVTPYTRNAMATLRSHGLREGSFYVPFSNGDYPKYAAEKWHHLRELAHLSYRQDYEDDCKEWCKKHGIGTLSEETMSRCFKMPYDGVPVKHPYYETMHYPACHESCMDSTVVDKLGTWCSNNGKVVFVYYDGHTYVAKGYGIINALRAAGYKEGSLFVPFSNGETITDPYLASLWEGIPKR